MKLVKYLVAALLVISITKKVHVTPSSQQVQDLSEAQSKLAPAPSISLKNSKNLNYNAKTATAQLNNTTYIGVVEYSTSAVAPNVVIPALTAFAEIKTPHYKAPTKPIVGGIESTTPLFGLPVAGTPLTVTAIGTSGSYWQQNQIVRLNNGTIFVAVREDKQKNYVENHALGPIWTRYSDSEVNLIWRLYGYKAARQSLKKFKSALPNLVQKIGSVQQGNQTVHLYGIHLHVAAST